MKSADLCFSYGDEKKEMTRAGANDDQLPIYETILSDLTAMEERIYGNRT